MDYTLENAIECAIQWGYNGIMEKDGKFLPAKDWHEIEYAQKCGWTYIGHPMDLI